jgi:predicted naringenin-chalcone synthase
MTRANPDDPGAKTVGAAIFGDGCAAVVIDDGATATGPSVVASKVHQIRGTLAAVRMELSDADGFLHLDRELPDLAAAGLAPLVDEFLTPLGLTRQDVDHWVVHPGGRRILECVGEALSLTREQLSASYNVLSGRGNVGTASIFYVLDETLRQRRPAPGQRALMITVGPGVTVGLLLLVF